MDNVIVTQADREQRKQIHVAICLAFIEGRQDAWDEVDQAFARHRIEATRQADADKAELVEAIRSAAVFLQPEPSVLGRQIHQRLTELYAKHGGALP